MLAKVFKAYDIRGVYPDPLSEDDARRIGFAAAGFLRDAAKADGATGRAADTVLVGRDMRASSPSLAAALIHGLNAAGVNVVDLGLVDTPFLYFAVNHLDAAGAIQTTASHNPPQYNGFKISRRKAKPVGETTGLLDIRKAAEAADPARFPAPSGRAETRDLWNEYAAHVRSFVDLGAARLKVVVDASNGMAGTMVPRVFGPRGSAVPNLELIELNFDNARNHFEHEPNPLLPSALAQAAAAVREHNAHAGLVFDGDADRCVVLDETGKAIGCDLLTAWLAPRFLKAQPGAAIIYDLRSSKAVEETVRAAGGVPVRSRVGHVFMKQLLAERRGAFGGELSGHFYFAGNFNADSGAIAMAAVLSALAHADKPLSACIAPLARYPQSGEINFQIEDKDGALARLRSTYADRGAIDELDGVTVDCFASEGWWCNVRKSNTEPLLRLNLEARDRATLDKMLHAIAPTLGHQADH